MADAHDIQSWLNGDKLRSRKIREQYPLIGLIVALLFLYILTGYQAGKQQHRLTDTKKEMGLHPVYHVRLVISGSSAALLAQKGRYQHHVRVVRGWEYCLLCSRYIAGDSFE